jgi:oligopeptide/dipeptide ABC transporter ATP-binding protein
MKEEKPLLSIKNLKLYFETYEGTVKALENISFDIYAGETVGLVGETGCGKSITALSVMGLIPIPPGKIMESEIFFEGEDLLKKTEEEMQHIRGNEISMIFQEPMTALNPVYTIGDQIAEVLILHKVVEGVDKKKIRKYNLPERRRQKKILEVKALQKAVEALKMTKISDPEKVVNQYPHELSGGMRQRAMIAMMLACNPKLLIADEPTTALDVTVQAQIIDLMKDMQRRTNAAIWLITHDLGVVAETCDKVGVMYAGYIVEFGDVKTIFNWPNHPYTRGLLSTIPKITKKREKLDIIPGFVPNLITPPSGCRFHPRCKYTTDKCKKTSPLLVEIEKNHFVACHHHEDVKLSIISKYRRVKP